MSKNTVSDNKDFKQKITLEDFNTFKPNTHRLEQFEDAKEFNSKYRNLLKAQTYLESVYPYFKNTNKRPYFTLEQLKYLGFVSQSEGRPDSSLTKEKWEQEFLIRKRLLEPVDLFTDQELCFDKMENQPDNLEYTYYLWYKKGCPFKDVDLVSCSKEEQYYYFINDILSNLRQGEQDYCYYIYQIMDILKIHHEDLQTVYCKDENTDFGFWVLRLDSDTLENRQEGYLC